MATIRSLVPVLFLAVLVGWWEATPARAQESPPPTLVIEGVHLIDGTGSSPVQDAVLIVEGSILSFVGKKADAPEYPPNARLLSLEGRWVIPGLIDSHVHYREWMPEFFPYYGVTSILDTGNPTDWILAQREAVRLGKIKGPRIFAAGTGINGPPPTGAPEDESPSHITVRSADEAAVAARQLLDRGVDAIKIHYRLPPEWVEVVAKEAHRAGKPVIGHMGAAVDVAVRSGLDALIHPYGIDLTTIPSEKIREEIRQKMESYQRNREYYPYHLLEPAHYAPLIQLMIQHKVFFNPTFGAQFRGVYPQREHFEAEDRAFLASHSEEMRFLAGPVRQRLLPFFTRMRVGPVDQKQRSQLEDGMEKVAAFMRQFQAAGGKLLAGTDSSRLGIPGMRFHRELELWVSLGIPPLEVLRAATQYPAQLLRQDHRLGTLEKGKLADLVVLNKNPLQDISGTRDIAMVIQDGKVVDRTFQPEFVNPIPSTHVRERFLPTLGRIEPDSAALGSPTLTLNIFGSNFDSMCRVLLNLAELQTRFISPQQLEATVPASLLREPGTYPVTVWRNGSGGGPSNPLYLLLHYGGLP
ncbi:MAG: amidohydrolase family protein [Acidobacteria bacterium]|nr:amidohydrolase family protein [Acidobacteriota bacterium]